MSELSDSILKELQRYSVETGETESLGRPYVRMGEDARGKYCRFSDVEKLLKEHGKVLNMSEKTIEDLRCELEDAVAAVRKHGYYTALPLHDAITMISADNRARAETIGEQVRKIIELEGELKGREVVVENWISAYDKTCCDRDELLNYLTKIADAAHAGQSNLSREESTWQIIARLTAVAGYEESQVRLSTALDRHVLARQRLTNWMTSEHSQTCEPPDSPEEAAIRILRELRAKVSDLETQLLEFREGRVGLRIAELEAEVERLGGGKTARG